MSARWVVSAAGISGGYSSVKDICSSRRFNVEVKVGAGVLGRFVCSMLWLAHPPKAGLWIPYAAAGHGFPQETGADVTGILGRKPLDQFPIAVAAVIA